VSRADLATAIKDARRRGVDLRRLANDVGIPENTVKRIEEGERPVGGIARTLEQALNAGAESAR
jgi:ribosome-binding protein aMBF1 (putative translation factor)